MKIYSDSNERIPDNKIGIQLTLSGYTALCYTMISQDTWFEIIKQSAALYLSFGIFAGIYLLKSGLYLYDLFTSKNKNLSKVGTFLRELLATIFFISAIIFGLFSNTVLGALSPYFFVLSTGVGLLYHFSIFTYTGLRYFLINDEELKNIYKVSCKKHFINFSLFSIGITLLSCFLLTNIAHLAFGIANAVFNACCFVWVACMTWKAKASKKMHIEKESKEDEIPFFPQPINNYYSSQNREKYLSHQVSQKDFLLSEIDEKINLIEMHIENSKSSILEERIKRENKIIALRQLKKIILNPFTNRDHFEELLKEPLFHTVFNNPFQSFFKKKSDTWEIFLAARMYFQNRDDALQDVTQTYSALRKFS